MSIVQEKLNQQLRQLFRARRRCDRKRSRQSLILRHCYCLHYRRRRRVLGGQDRVIKSSSHCRDRLASLPVGSRSIVPLLHIWLRLNKSCHSLSAYLNNERVRVEKCSVLQNVCQIFASKLNSFYRLFRPAPKTEKDVGSVGLIEKRCEPQPPNIFKRIFYSLSDMVEIALLAEAGPSPKYVYKSPAMNALNLDELFYSFKSTIIDHMLDNDCDYFLINPEKSLTILATTNCY